MGHFIALHSNLRHSWENEKQKFTRSVHAEHGFMAGLTLYHVSL